jgi:hypothetical protein
MIETLAGVRLPCDDNNVSVTLDGGWQSSQVQTTYLVPVVFSALMPGREVCGKKSGADAVIRTRPGSV